MSNYENFQAMQMALKNGEAKQQAMNIASGLSRQDTDSFFSKLPACTIGRVLATQGHRMGIMSKTKTQTYMDHDVKQQNWTTTTAPETQENTHRSSSIKLQDQREQMVSRVSSRNFLNLASVGPDDASDVDSMGSDTVAESPKQDQDSL